MYIRCVLVLGLIALFGLYSCHRPSHERAEAELQRIDSLRMQGLYKEALVQLDEMHSELSAEPNLIRRLMQLKNRTRREEAEQELVRIDRELGDLQKALSQELQSFEYLGTEGAQWYYHHRLTPQAQGARPHLRAMVDSVGGVRLVSVYVGARAVEHSSLSFSLSSVDSVAKTTEVPHDAALNYRYMDGEKYWELVTYTAQSLSQVEPYLTGLSKGKLRIDFLSNGRSVFRQTLTPQEQKALEATLLLSQKLEQRQRLRQEQAKYAQRYVRLSQKG